MTWTTGAPVRAPLIILVKWSNSDDFDDWRADTLDDWRADARAVNNADEVV